MGKKSQGLISRPLRAARLLARTLCLSLLVATTGAQTRAVLHRTPVEYPPLADKMHISGTVTVLVAVEPSGNVTSARAIKGHALLRPAAEKAVLQWKFATAPTPAETNIDIQFQPRGEGPR